jgi:hypothetical protein
MLHEQLDQPRVIGEDVDWPGLDLRQHPLVEILNLISHRAMLATALTADKRVGSGSRQRVAMLAFEAGLL